MSPTLRHARRTLVVFLYLLDAYWETTFSQSSYGGNKLQYQTWMRQRFLPASPHTHQTCFLHVARHMRRLRTTEVKGLTTEETIPLFHTHVTSLFVPFHVCSLGAFQTPVFSPFSPLSKECAASRRGESGVGYLFSSC
ncbi:uncharacterized protein IWZ02DRAFT_67870 [Phyllosticta citriasiana]|uniref:uncharacterized protein n=1 Tax=Phyllosticta citriasiana TaxID=595635 RepID=UPI0030FD8721